MKRYLLINKIFNLINYLIRILYFFINKNKKSYKVLVKTTLKNIKFYCDLKNEYKYKYPTNLLRIFGMYEPLTSLFLKKNLKPHDIVLEIGAAYGYFTVQMCLQSKFVHSVEPSAKMVRVLKYNLELNNLKNCKIHSMGIGEDKKIIIDGKKIKKTLGLKEFLFKEKIHPNFIFVDADASSASGKPINVGEKIVEEILKINFDKKIKIFFETKNYSFYKDKILNNKNIKIKKLISHQHFFFIK